MKNKSSFAETLTPRSWDNWEPLVERWLRDGKANAATDHYKRLLATYRAESGGGRDLEIGACLVRLGSIYLELGEWPQACLCFKEGIENAQKVFGDTSAHLSRVLRRYARGLCKMASLISTAKQLPPL